MRLGRATYFLRALGAARFVSGRRRAAIAVMIWPRMVAITRCASSRHASRVANCLGESDALAISVFVSKLLSSVGKRWAYGVGEAPRNVSALPGELKFRTRPPARPLTT